LTILRCLQSRLLDSIMDSVMSRSMSFMSKVALAGRSTQMVPLAIGHGIHLITTCLLNRPTSRMSVSEIYEWLAEKYLSYLYTKHKIRYVLRHDFERRSLRFVILTEIVLQECQFNRLFSLEQRLNSVDCSVALPLPSLSFPNLITAFLN
jgi:hypothetical protein